MDLTTATLLLWALLNSVEAFPPARRETSSIGQRRDRLFSSQGDGIQVGGGDPSSGVDVDAATTTRKIRKEAIEEDDDSNALSSLLGDMFQAKLEMSQEKKELESLVTENSDMPLRGHDGIYRIINQRQLENFRAANTDKLVFLKFSSPICAACRMLRQKFQTLHRSPKFAGAPVVFADIVISNNKRVKDPFRDYITSQLRVQRVPTIQFYAGGGGGSVGVGVDGDALADRIYCDDDGGCSWPKIQQQMLDFMGRHYTAPTPTQPPPQKVEAMHNVSSVATVAGAAASASPRKVSKRQRIRRILSLSWLRQ